jgi:hypothetical protein
VRRIARAVILLACAVGIANPSAPASAQARVRQFGQSSPQSPDSAAVVRRARRLQAKFERQRRHQLPRFYTGAPTRCLIVGRFCHSDGGGSYDVVPEEGNNIRRARELLLRDLEEAANTSPTDDWIVGQRVRYHVEARDTLALHVARACAATRWWCDALTGYALHTSGDFSGADSAFSRALDGMPPPMRCHWINVAPLLDADRREYRRLPCDQREALVARIWWLADPLLMTPGNERRTEHFSRVLHTTLLQKDAVSTFGTSWGGDLAELTIRFGWPEKWTQQPSPSSYSGAQPSITGHEREPGFHFFLTQWPPDSLRLIADSLWDLNRTPPREQYSPLYARAFARLDAQVARFRRGDSTVVVAAYDMSADTLFRHRKFAAALVAMADEATAPARHEVADAAVKQVMMLTTPWKSQLVGVELLARDSAGAAARWRSGFGELPLPADGISVSDLLFVDGVTLPDNLGDAVPHAHGGTVFRRDAQVGLFWEIYGKAPVDSALPISLTISPLETGRFRAALGALRIAAKATPLEIRWQENGASGMLSARSVLLDLSRLRPGKYEVRLEVGPAPLAKTSSVIRVQ